MATYYGPRTFIADRDERKTLAISVPATLHVERIRVDVSEGKIGVCEVRFLDRPILDRDVSGSGEGWISPQALADTRFDVKLPVAAQVLFVTVEALVDSSECCLIVDGTRP